DGWQVRHFDLVDGDDVRDFVAVRAAAAGCDVVVHAAALNHDSKGTPTEMLATNVLGTWHVLLAAEQAGMQRVVSCCSVQVFGCSENEGEPVYLPLDDDHPRRASRPYGRSKRLVEDLCEMWTARSGTATVVLRPVLTLSDEHYARTDTSQLD